MKWLVLLFPSLCFATEYNFTYHLIKQRVDNTVKVKVEAIANACTNPNDVLDEEFYR